MPARTSLLLAAGLLAACRPQSPTPPAPAAPAVAPPAAPAPSPAPSPADELDRMDARAPVPLLPMMANHQKQNMRGHLGAVEQVIGGLAAKDFAQVETAAGQLGLSPEMEQMCQHMGMGAPGFTDRALEFHKSADAIVGAARAKDEAKALAALDVTLKACTGCHEAYKQRVVDEAGWRAATSGAPPHHPQ